MQDLVEKMIKKSAFDYILFLHNPEMFRRNIIRFQQQVILICYFKEIVLNLDDKLNLFIWILRRLTYS